MMTMNERKASTPKEAINQQVPGSSMRAEIYQIIKTLRQKCKLIH